MTDDLVPDSPLDRLPDPVASADPIASSDADHRVAATGIALVGSGAALVAVCSLLAIPVGPSGVPITLQTFAVLLVGALLGSRRGALAVLLYLAVGVAGLPVFAGGSGGLATFAQASAGYLLAFPVAAWLTGLVVERGSRPGVARAARLTVAGLAGTAAIYSVRRPGARRADRGEPDRGRGPERRVPPVRRGQAGGRRRRGGRGAPGLSRPDPQLTVRPA